MRASLRALQHCVWLLACSTVIGPASSAAASARAASAANDPGLELQDDPPELMAVVAERQEQRLAEQSRELQAEREAVERRLRLRGRVLVRWLRNGSFPQREGVPSMMDHAVRVESLRRALLRDVERVADLKATAARVQAQLQQRRRQRARLRSELTDYRRSKEAILAAKEREQAYRRAFGDSAPGDGHTAIYGSLPKQADVASFADLRGRLPFPVRGRAEVIGVPPTDEHAAAAKMRVPAGGKAYSVHSGRVVLIGDYKGLGRGIVIEHDGGYATLTANLSVAEVQVGQQVPAGAELGEIRSRGGRAELHFELRYEGGNLLPTEWFGL